MLVFFAVIGFVVAMLACCSCLCEPQRSSGYTPVYCFWFGSPCDCSFHNHLHYHRHYGHRGCCAGTDCNACPGGGGGGSGCDCDCKDCKQDCNDPRALLIILIVVVVVFAVVGLIFALITLTAFFRSVIKKHIHLLRRVEQAREQRVVDLSKPRAPGTQVIVGEYGLRCVPLRLAASKRIAVTHVHIVLVWFSLLMPPVSTEPIPPMTDSESAPLLDYQEHSSYPQGYISGMHPFVEGLWPHPHNLPSSGQRSLLIPFPHRASTLSVYSTTLGTTTR